MATYLVAGANRGLGLEFAHQLKGRGDTVIATARHPGGAAALAAAGCEMHALDIGDEVSIRALAEALGDRALDVVICNAGVFPDRGQGLADFDGQALLDCLRVNALGPLLLLRHLLPHLERSRRRLCVNIGSQMGSIARATNLGHPRDYAYCSSKAALNMHTVLAANELRDRGVAVVVMHPGWVRTDMGGSDAALSPAQSVTGMLEVIDGLTLEQSGSYIDYEGQPLAW